MNKINVSIAGGSGYAGGELLRLLFFHPHVRIQQVTSEHYSGKFLFKVHPNLRKLTNLKFSSLDDLEACDVLFLALPHGSAMRKIDQFIQKAERIIDLSADFRLTSKEVYHHWYKRGHACPEYLNQFIYGIPELHRKDMVNAKWISSAGCNATATILALYPFYKNNLVQTDRTVVEVKVGSSEGGNRNNASSHHPVRSGAVRSFAPTGHRHVAEIVQELTFDRDITIHFSATSIEMVRGVLATCHVFLNRKLKERDIWKIYRQTYGKEPFIRLVKEADGNYRFPEPKLLIGTNFCDIGFSLDESSDRLVLISALDNLMKGAAGQAVQALNIMFGWEETTALSFPGLHPI